VSAAGLSIAEVFEQVAVVIAVGTPAQVRLLAGSPAVAGVYPPAPFRLSSDSALQATGVEAVRSDARFDMLRRPDGTPFDGSGVSIAVIDSGIDANHEMFVENGDSKVDVQLRQSCEAALFDNGVGPLVCGPWVPSEGDEHGVPHGTHVASIAAGYERTTSSGRRVSGVATGARLIELGLGDPASAQFATLGVSAVSALNWVLDHHHDPCGDGSCPPIRVVNLSAACCLGEAADPNWPEIRLASALADAGVVVVWAAGNIKKENGPNDGTKSTMNAMADNPTPGVISVGNYYDGEVGDRDLGVHYTSGRGKRGEPATYPDVVAPGMWVWGACPTTSACPALLGTPATFEPGYRPLSGTSMATPHVAGLAALLLEANPDLTAGQVEDILEDSAYKFGAEAEYTTDPTNPKDDASYRAGHGLVDAVGAVSLALGRGKRTAPPACGDVESNAVMIVDDPETVPIAAQYDITRIDATWPEPRTAIVDVRLADLSGPPIGGVDLYNLEFSVDGEHIELWYVPDNRSTGTTTVYSAGWAPQDVAATATRDAAHDRIRFTIQLGESFANAHFLGGVGAFTNATLPVFDFVYGACAVRQPRH
jgi:serine protease AprX